MGMCSRQERIQKDIDVVIQKSRAEKDCLFADFRYSDSTFTFTYVGGPRSTFLDRLACGCEKANQQRPELSASSFTSRRSKRLPTGGVSFLLPRLGAIASQLTATSTSRVQMILLPQPSSSWHYRNSELAPGM
uniref:Poly(ADP-ribose) polymerase family member 8 n=1 Tax=Pongo abelii TaxID=9601 RepID=A0A8I5U7L0_PONAB